MRFIFALPATFAEAVTPAVVLGGFIFWVSPSHRLTAAEAFTCLAIIALISKPLMNILRCGTVFTPALGCMRRIEEYLLLEDRKDCRTDLEPADIMGEKVRIVASISSHPAVGPLSSNQSDIFIRGDRVSISSQSGNYIIHNTCFTIRRSTLTVITGPVGSGKSVLLQALLGEITFDGTIQLNPLNSLIAYCNQVPWIRNLSIRRNIIGDQPLDLAWYETVLNTCLLGEDLSQLLDGDDTLAGSNGANLSGGQKQRIVS